jgi:hypothetical protein
MAILGALAGSITGSVLDGEVSERHTLALLSALVAVVVVAIVRWALGARFPSLFVVQTNAPMPLMVWIAILFSALVGGLAAHDLIGLGGHFSGRVLGLVAGILATLCMGICVILYYRDAFRDA